MPTSGETFYPRATKPIPNFKFKATKPFLAKIQIPRRKKEHTIGVKVQTSMQRVWLRAKL